MLQMLYKKSNIIWVLELGWPRGEKRQTFTIQHNLVQFSTLIDHKNTAESAELESNPWPFIQRPALRIKVRLKG